MTSSRPGLLAHLGPLRVIIAIFVLILIAFAPFAGGEVQTDGWAIVPTLIVPTLVPLAMFCLPIDIIMSRVFMGSKEGAERSSYRVVIAINLILLAALFIAWGPFLISLLQPAA